MTLWNMLAVGYCLLSLFAAEWLSRKAKTRSWWEQPTLYAFFLFVWPFAILVIASNQFAEFICDRYMDGGSK